MASFLLLCQAVMITFIDRQGNRFVSIEYRPEDHYMLHLLPVSSDSLWAGYIIHSQDCDTLNSVEQVNKIENNPINSDTILNLNENPVISDTKSVQDLDTEITSGLGETPFIDV